MRGIFIHSHFINWNLKVSEVNISHTATWASLVFLRQGGEE